MLAWRGGGEEARVANLAEGGEEPKRRGEEARRQGLPTLPPALLISMVNRKATSSQATSATRKHGLLPAHRNKVGKPQGLLALPPRVPESWPEPAEIVREKRLARLLLENPRHPNLPKLPDFLLGSKKKTIKFRAPGARASEGSSPLSAPYRVSARRLI